MRATEFSFPCPAPAYVEDETFERFFETAQKEPNKIHNPWPQLARRKNFRQARTEPIPRIRYLPSSNPDFYPNADFESTLTYAHELYHVGNPQSPAMILASLLLGDAFDSLSVLLHKFTWDSEMEMSWAKLGKITRHLSDICESITLSEELLATAASFVAGSNVYSEDREVLEILSEIEEDILANSTNLPPCFGLYYQTFKKVLGWALEEPDLPLLFTVELYLQGIKISRSPRAILSDDMAKEGFLVVDSAKRCRILAESVKTLRSGKELFDWLLCQLRGTKEVGGLLTAQAVLTYEQKFSKERKNLWILLQGGAEFAVETIEQATSYEWIYSTPNHRGAIVYPQEFDRGWYLTYLFDASNKCQEAMEASENIFAFNSLLEQLTSGNGICCPHFNPLERCRCDPDWKGSLNRILQWAREGKFGYGGIWRDIQPECRCNP